VGQADKEHGDVTALMTAAANGDRAAADGLLPLIYEQLRRSAQAQMAGERAGHTLSATALVHEAYVKLAGPRQVPWANRGHFYAAAAEAMRRILVDHARSRAARGRADGERGVRLEAIGDVGALSGAEPEQIVAVDSAVTRLEREDPEAAALVRLRFYAGLSVEQSAEVLGMSSRTAARVWTYARAVLYRWLREGS
jgi:RNA polymerase sigma factor (TIGR02999 family)